MRVRGCWKPCASAIATAIVIARPSVGWADSDTNHQYLYFQIGPILGIVDDSFMGNYDDTIGVNGRVGAKGESWATELQVEGLPGSIVNRNATSEFIGKDVVNVTINLKLFRDVGPFEIYGVAGLGLITLTEVIVTSALASGSETRTDESRKIDFHARAGLGIQFPLAPHVYGYAEGSWNGGAKKTDQYSYMSLTTGIGIRF